MVCAAVYKTRLPRPLVLLKIKNQKKWLQILLRLLIQGLKSGYLLSYKVEETSSAKVDGFMFLSSRSLYMLCLNTSR